MEEVRTEETRLQTDETQKASERSPAVSRLRIDLLEPRVAPLALWAD